MNKEELWNKFLENIKNEITDVSFTTWFNDDDTKLYSFENDVATVVVSRDFIKKHLEERYLDIMIDGMSRVTNSDVTFNIILQEIGFILSKKTLNYYQN